MNIAKERRRMARVRVTGSISWARNSPDAIGVKEVAELVGRGQTWVKEHAEELGGYQFETRDLGHNRPGKTWRFSRARIELKQRLGGKVS